MCSFALSEIIATEMQNYTFRHTPLVFPPQKSGSHDTTIRVGFGKQVAKLRHRMHELRVMWSFPLFVVYVTLVA